ncbi:MAG: Gfo/Idh/MocA family oxidoreductase [Paracoccaceae bacterium]|nr:Gfo/Idh/MocA family oxidoreductase [Paracoccaceae bacterium]
MRAALIGLGMVADTHVAAIAATNGRITLEGVCSRHPDGAAKFAQRVSGTVRGAPKVYASVAEVAADPAVDVAILVTPPNARVEAVETLARAGKPILMEKPIERTLAAATHIVETCEAANVPLGIFLQHRMRASARRLSALLAEGALGEIGLVEIAVPWWRTQGYYDEPGRGTYARDGGGVLISQAIHTLDLALTFTGPALRVQAMARTTRLHRMEAEDVVTAGIDYASGAVGSLFATTASHPGTAESITLHGTKGSARVVSGRLDLTWRDGTTDTFGEAGGTGGGADPMAFTHAWHQAVLEDFADALEAGRPPAVTGRSALAVHHLIEALVTSSREGRAIDLSEIT